jgi:hypothetical protein
MTEFLVSDVLYPYRKVRDRDTTVKPSHDYLLCCVLCRYVAIRPGFFSHLPSVVDPDPVGSASFFWIRSYEIMTPQRIKVKKCDIQHTIKLRVGFGSGSALASKWKV